MWIKEKPQKLGESGCCIVNFLYNSDKIYVTDNHLSASWCWLQKIDVSKKYNFIHIDRHYDLCDYKDEIKSEILDKGVNIQHLTFEEYLSLDYEVDGHRGRYAKLFRWDNFILNIHNIFPKIFARTFFITKKVGAKSDIVDYEDCIVDFINEYENWLDDNTNIDWIVDLDLDFFVAMNKGNHYQLYSDETIIKVATLIKKNIEKIKVLTIALSPECCGGWDNSIRIFNIIKDILEIDINL